MIFYERFQQTIEGIIQYKLDSSKCILFTILQTYTRVTQESISATRMLSVTILKALTIVRANQDILEMAFIAQVNIVTKSLIAKTLTLSKNILIHPVDAKVFVKSSGP